MADAQVLTGKMIGMYHLDTEIDSNVVSGVYSGKQNVPVERSVAIKCWHALHLSPKMQHQFLQEARLLKMLKHPHLLPILDVGIFEDMPYLVTEYAASGSLRERIEQWDSRPVSKQEALIILSQVGQALQYIHQLHLTHGNLTPENILFTTQGEELLADMAIRTLQDASSSTHPHHLRKAHYMAPEQFQGQTSPASDQYALGCIAYELFTGRVPFTASDFSTLERKHVEESPLAPTLLNMLLPLHLEEAVLKALSKQQADRHASVKDFLAALGRVSLFQAPPFPIPAAAHPIPPNFSTSPSPARPAGFVSAFKEIKQLQGEEARLPNIRGDVQQTDLAEASASSGNSEAKVKPGIGSSTGVPADRAMEQIDPAKQETAVLPVHEALLTQDRSHEWRSSPVAVPVKTQMLAETSIPVRDEKAQHPLLYRSMGGRHTGHQDSRVIWFAIMITAIVIVTAISGLFFWAFLPAHSPRTATRVTTQGSSENPSTEPATAPSPLPSATLSRTPSPALSPSPQPSPNPSSTPTVSPTPIPELTVTPGGFNARTDCTIRGHLYTCIAILALSQNAPGGLTWTASSNGLRQVSFSPSSGTLSPGQQQQVQIDVRSDCPVTGSLLFSGGGSRVTMTWSC